MSIDPDQNPDHAGGTAAAHTRGRSLLTPVLAGVVVALGVATLVLGILVSHDARIDRARAEALDVAQRQAIAMLAYTPDDVDARATAAAEGLTDEFRGEYLTLMNDVVAPAAKEKQITVDVTVPDATVIEGGTGTASVLLFVNQNTRSTVNPQSLDSGSRVRLDLVHESGRWLVSNLTTV